MTRTLLLAAVAAFAIAGCEPAGPANEAVESVNSDAAAPGNGAALPEANAGSPGECKATEGVSDGPYCGFTAVQNLFPPVKQPTLTVKGKYWLNRRTGSVTLVERLPRDFNPTILAINVSISASGGGGDWVDAIDKFNATDGQYKTVTLYDPNGAKIDIPVSAIH